MSIRAGMIRAAHHVGLPSWEMDWPDIRTFWESLGLECRTHRVTKEDYDHAGAGVRLQVFVGGQLIVSYYGLKSSPSGFPESCMSKMHLAFAMVPPALAAVRSHERFDRETHCGHGNTSVFLTDPYGLHVELVTTNPDYHLDPP